MKPIEFMKNEYIRELFWHHGRVYRKAAMTSLRLPMEHEIGTVLVTYKTDGNSYREEMRDTILGNRVIARNSHVVLGYDNGNPVYNEWIVPIPDIIKNYGEEVFQDLNTEFKDYKKNATVQMIELSQYIFDYLGGIDHLLVKVDWSDEPMIAHVGDYLCDRGYIISNQNFKDYESV